MKTLVGALTVGAALNVASAFMQAADAQQIVAVQFDQIEGALCRIS